MALKRQLVLSALLVTAACGESAPPPAPAAAPKAAEKKDDKKDEKKDATSADAAREPTYEYSYSPVGKRDPFRSPIDDAQKKEEETPTTGKDCGPLCHFELEQFKLVAVISGLSNPVAMVEDPAGVGFVIRRGTFMGKHNGKVTQIRTGEIEVSEIFKDQMGKPHVNPKIIKLPSDAKQDTEAQNLLGPETSE